MKKVNLLLILILLIAFGLRFYKIGLVPPALYWDEAAMALDAKAVALTGKDQHGNLWLQAIYPSWGDYKLPGYIICAVPFFWVFKNSPELAIRFPSVLAGTLTVLLTYFLCKAIFEPGSKNSSEPGSSIGLIAAFLLAISPWHLHFSRAAFEANLALFFNFLGLIFFLKARKKKPWLIFFILFMVLGIYTYYSARIVMPLLFILSFLLFWKINLKSILSVLFSLGIVVFLCLPLKLSPLAEQAEQFRLSTKNVFNNPELLVYSNTLINQDNRSILAKKIHHRFLYQAKTLASHYFDHFSLNFLLLSGDPNLRHSTGRIGVLLLVGFLGLIFGEYYLFANNKKIFIYLNICLLVSFLPACVPDEVPHSLRSLNAVIFLSSIGGFGLFHLSLKLIKIKKVLILITLFLLLFTQLLFYLHDYYIHYPFRSYLAWQGGYKQAVWSVNREYTNAQKIIFSPYYARPYLYFLLYSQYSLKSFQEQRAQILAKEPLNYQETEKIDKIEFRGINDLDKLQEKILIIGAPNEIQGNNVIQINPAFNLWKNY